MLTFVPTFVTNYDPLFSHKETCANATYEGFCRIDVAVWRISMP